MHITQITSPSPKGGESADEIGARFDKSVRRQCSGCWIWAGSKTGEGYGQFYVGDRRTAAHRWSYERHHGPVSDDLVIDHLCRNRACVNPEHLEPVTNRVNVLRGVSPAAINGRKTHCSHGHEFTPKNTRLLSNGHRRCRECDRARKQAKGVNPTYAACGRMGGRVTVSRHGNAHMVATAHKGGAATKAKHGPDYYREIGRKGGLKSQAAARQFATSL